MKVLFYLPHGLVGGAEKQVEYLIRGAAGSSMAPVVLYKDKVVESFVRQLRVPFTRVYSPGSVMSVIQRVRPVIVQSNINQFYPDGVLYEAMNRIGSPPVSIGVVHDRLWFPSSASAGKGIEDAAVGVSCDAKCFYETRIKGTACIEIHNGVDSSIYNEGIRSSHVDWKTGGRRPCGGFCGRLNEQKGISRILGIAAAMPGVDFELVGEGGDSYRKQLTDENIRNVRIYPQASEVVEYYKRWDFFISCSPSEGFGLSIAEAVACGVPSVIWQCGGITEMLRNREDCLIVKSDSEILEALDDILQQGWKPEVYGRPDLSHTRMARKYMDLYRQITDGIELDSHSVHDLRQDSGSVFEKCRFVIRGASASLSKRKQLWIGRIQRVVSSDDKNS